MQASITTAAGATGLSRSMTLTSQQPASGTVTYSGPAVSAEWIEELPTAVGSAQPALANFGSATFTNMTYTSGPAPSPDADRHGRRERQHHRVGGPDRINGVSSPSPTPTCRAARLLARRSDGGIFSFGRAQFYGSTGSLHLQRPVVGIVPTADHGGYWLDASDGGVFAYGNTQYYGSIPGLGLHPAGSGLPNSLNAPIVGMVPSSTTTATSWWPPTAGSSPSVMPTSPGPAPASAAARALRWPSCPTPVATATGW